MSSCSRTRQLRACLASPLDVDVLFGARWVTINQHQAVDRPRRAGARIMSTPSDPIGPRPLGSARARQQHRSENAILRLTAIITATTKTFLFIASPAVAASTRRSVSWFANKKLNTTQCLNEVSNQIGCQRRSTPAATCSTR